MTIFKELEKKLEDMFEGFFRNQFRSALQPVELARRMSSEMDRGRRVGVANTYVPNIFNVSLAETDFHEIEGFKETLLAEFTDYLAAYAGHKKYFLTGSFEISFNPDSELKSGDCLVDGRIGETHAELETGTQIIPPEEAAAFLETEERGELNSRSLKLRFSLKNAEITVGRQSGNDIVLTSSAVSRRHARLEWNSKTYRLIDLASTNGTFVNNRQIKQTILNDGDLIIFGDIELTFRHK